MASQPQFSNPTAAPKSIFQKIRTNMRYGRRRAKRGKTYTKRPVELPPEEIIMIDGVAVSPKPSIVTDTAASAKPQSRISRLLGVTRPVPVRPQALTKTIPGRTALRGYLPATTAKNTTDRRTVRVASLPQDDEEDVSSDDDTSEDTSDEDDAEEESNAGPLSENPFRVGGLKTIDPTLDYAFSEIDPDDIPEEVTFEQGYYQPRNMQRMVVNWRASNLHHNPLYFEDPQLERYGHTYHPMVQPFASSARFAVQLVGLPYQMAMDPVWKRRYTLGWYRPGESAPYLRHRFPFNNKASLIQAATVAGLFFIIP